VNSVPLSDSVGPSLPAPAHELLSLAADWAWAADTQLRITQVVSLRDETTPMWVDRLIGLRPWDSPLFVADRRRARQQMRRLWRHVPFRDLELQWALDDGQRWTAISGVPRCNPAGQFAGYVGVAVDITARKRLELSLRDARAELDATLRALPDLMFEIDADGVFHAAHAPRPELLLRPPRAVIGRRQNELLPPEVLSVAQAALREALEHGHTHGHRYRLQLPDGQLRWFELSLARKTVPSGDKPRCVAIVRDITELKQREAQLSAWAFYDPLTGLPNRRLLLDRIEQALLRQQRQPAWSVLLFVDLDDFKRVNDTYGHAAGDAVLVRVAQALRAVVRESDPVGRLAGDEFVALLEDAGTSEREARGVAQRASRDMLRRLKSSHGLDGEGGEGAGAISASIGALLFRGYCPLADLLGHADALMYRAKKLGKGAFVIERWSLRSPPPLRKGASRGREWAR